jgi:hypothetical protein
MLSRRFAAARPLTRAFVPAVAAPRPRFLVNQSNKQKLAEVEELVDPTDIDDPYMVSDCERGALEA